MKQKITKGIFEAYYYTDNTYSIRETITGTLYAICSFDTVNISFDLLLNYQAFADLTELIKSCQKELNN